MKQDQTQNSKSEMDFVLKNFTGTLTRFFPRLPFALNLIQLFLLMKDPKSKWTDIAPALAALVYFVTPIDAVPDMIPGAGFMDDAAVVATVIMALGSRLSVYEPQAKAFFEKIKTQRNRPS